MQYFFSATETVVSFNYKSWIINIYFLLYFVWKPPKFVVNKIGQTLLNNNNIKSIVLQHPFHIAWCSMCGHLQCKYKYILLLLFPVSFENAMSVLFRERKKSAYMCCFTMRKMRAVYMCRRTKLVGWVHKIEFVWWG